MTPFIVCPHTFRPALRLRSVAVLMLVLGQLGCSSSEDAAANRCEGVGISASSGRVAQPIDLLGVPEPGPDTRVRLRGDESEIEVGVFGRNDGSVWFSTPLHPDLEGEAGELDLRVTYGGTSCELGVLGVEALPAADERVAFDVLDRLETLVLQINESFGFDPQAFDPAAQNGPTTLVQALLYFTVLDEISPVRVDALREQLVGFSSEERVLAARWLVEVGLLAQLDELIARYDGLSIPSDAAPVGGFLPQAEVTAVARGVPKGLPSPAQVCSDILVGQFTPASIAGADDLARALQLSAEARARRDSLDNSLAGAVVTVAGIASSPVGLTATVAKWVALAVQSLLFVDTASDQNLAGLLPSTLLNPRMELSENPINEDHFDEPFATRPTWRAKVDAASRGLDLRVRALDALLLGAGALSVSDEVVIGFDGISVGSDYVLAPLVSEGDFCLSLPPAMWFDINVTNRVNLEDDPEVVGSSVTLEDPNGIVPAAIGTSRIEVKLDPARFPCDDDCPRSAEAQVEVIEKNVTFARSTYAADSESAEVTLSAAISNSSAPERFHVEVGEGATEVSVERDGSNFQIVVKGDGDRDLFPVEVVLESRSTDLPPIEGPRRDSAFVTLDTVVTLVQVSPTEGCIGPDTEVLLEATVMGVEPGQDGVTFSSPDAISLTPIGENQVEAVASATGRYLVVATSIADPSATAELEVGISSCDVELFVYASASASLDASAESAGCGNGSLPDGEEEENTIGELPDVDQGMLRHADSWTTGSSWSPGLAFIQAVTSTFRDDQSACRVVTFAENASVLGALSSEGDSGQLDFALEMDLGGECETDVRGPDDVICGGGNASLIVNASFVVDIVDPESASPWEISGELDCTLPPIPFVGGGPHPPNLIINVAAARGGTLLTQDQYLDFGSIIALGSAAAHTCLDGQPVRFSATFDPIDPEPGQGYTLSVVVGFTPFLAPSEPTDPGFSGAYDAGGTVTGAVRLSPAQN